MQPNLTDYMHDAFIKYLEEMVKAETPVTTKGMAGMFISITDFIAHFCCVIADSTNQPSANVLRAVIASLQHIEFYTEEVTEH